MAILELSQAFLFKVKRGQDCQQAVERLAGLSLQELKEALHTDAHRKTFWINIYNATNQYLMKQLPDLTGKSARLSFFAKKQISIAGHRISLNDIEHGILRRSKAWWGMGYLPDLFVGKFIKETRVEQPDPRIHFALNCGAKSCPPIRFYDVDKIEDQLELATIGYLTVHTKVQASPAKVWLPSLFLMYRGDFGGKKGILAFVRKYIDLPKEKFPVSYAPWNRSTQLDHFVE